MELTETMDLLAALRMEDLTAPPRLALVGAGGKSTALFLLARQLLEQYPTVLTTATTHLAPEQALKADHHVVLREGSEMENLRLERGVVLVTGSLDGPAGDSKTRLKGLDMTLQQRLLEIADKDQIPLLIEADGSRRLSLKAPAEYEPAIPGFMDQVVVVAGLSGLGKPLDSSSVHRPERFAALSGLAIGEDVTPAALVNVLAHPEGGLKNIPLGAQRILILNQAEEAVRQQAAESMVDSLLPYYSPVLVAALEQPGAPVYWSHEPVAGIILAAGGGQRYGGVPRFKDELVTSKLLLEWMEETLVHRSARLALEAGLHPVRVVTGAYSEEVARAVQDLQLEVVHNPDWAAGQSTSLKAGLSGLPTTTGAAVFLLGDQPFVTRKLLLALRREHALSLAPLIAPWCRGRRANPALFDRRTFPDLLALSGDTGGRALFNMPGRYTPVWLPWADERLLLDVDTPEDYRHLKEMGEP